MTTDYINGLLASPSYDFLRTNENLRGKFVFLTLGGSLAYGTNNASSDVDIRGCVLNSKNDILLGNQEQSFKQFEDRATDTVIYGFNKFIKLAADCNPNLIETLGCKPEEYFYVSDIGQELLENRNIFLSQKAFKSFGNYANQQLRRLQNALARDSYPQVEKERHIMGSIKSAMTDFDSRYQTFEEGSIQLFIDESAQEDLDEEIFVNVTLKHYPLRDYKNIWADMHNIIKDYGKLNKRNNKKDDIHLNKHAMHLVRLYLMCLDILENCAIITCRESDHDFLMEIRNGKYQKPDGTYYKEFFDIISDLGKRLEYAKENTALPENPDLKKIEEFVISVNERAIKL